MHLEIVTPEVKAFEGEVTGVKVPGANGSFEMLNNHAAIISNLTKGKVRVSSKSGDLYFDIDGGIVEMKGNHVVILAESAKKSAK